MDHGERKLKHGDCRLNEVMDGQGAMAVNLVRVGPVQHLPMYGGGL